jgi:hypothetical protein
VAAIEEGEAAGVERPLLEKARKASQALRKKKSQGKLMGTLEEACLWGVAGAPGTRWGGEACECVHALGGCWGGRRFQRPLSGAGGLLGLWGGQGWALVLWGSGAGMGWGPSS